MENNTLKVKKIAAKAAAEMITGDNLVIGIGSGTTVACFIEELSYKKHLLDGCVAASVASENLLKAHNIPILDLNAVGTQMAFYFDGADEINTQGVMLKGLGGALVREKIIASAAKKIICIADRKKFVNLLGQTVPVVLEVLPMARSLVARAIVAMGANPVYRQGYITDNGNVILDVYNLDIISPHILEEKLKALPGVVDSGVFYKQSAQEAFFSDGTCVEHKVFNTLK